MREKHQAGNTLLEFTLVGIPLVFVLISVFEISRGMWVYTTLAHAVREGTRYVIVHGQNCGNTPNTCTVTVGQVAQRIADAGIGLPADELSVTLQAPATGTVTCSPIQVCLPGGANAATQWPPFPDNVKWTPITITGVYPFRSALSMLWPGAGGFVFNGGQPFNLPASSQGSMQF